VTEKPQTFDERFAKFVINPYSKYLIAWQLTMTMVYLVAIILDSFIMSFHLQPLREPDINFWQTLFSFLMVIDIFLKFFIAFISTKQSTDEGSSDEEDLDRSHLVTAKVSDDKDSKDGEDDQKLILTRKQ